MLKHCVCCVALCMTQLGGIPVPTTIKRGKSSRKKKGVDTYLYLGIRLCVLLLFLEQSCYA